MATELATTLAARPATRPTGRSAHRAGAQAMVPYILGLGPFAVVIGATIGHLHSRWSAWAGVWPIFGGSAHLATVHALQDGGATIAILTGLMINIRVLAYGFAVAGRWREQPRWFRVLAPCLLVDPTFAASELYAADHPEPDEQRRFFLGAGLTLGVAFWVLVTAGMLVGSGLGEGLGLEIMSPLCLVAPLGGRARQQPAAVAAALGAFVIVVAGSWPNGTGMLAAVLVGAVGGLLVEGRRAR
jgi:predicted branched-subunit amino acid permease